MYAYFTLGTYFTIGIVVVPWYLVPYILYNNLEITGLCCKPINRHISERNKIIFDYREISRVYTLSKGQYV